MTGLRAGSLLSALAAISQRTARPKVHNEARVPFKLRAVDPTYRTTVPADTRLDTWHMSVTSLRSKAAESAAEPPGSDAPARRPASEAELALIFKQLADPTRLRILMELVRQSESNVSQLCEVLQQSQPLVSHHLALLRMAKLVAVRKSGKNHFYSIRRDQFQFLVDELFRQIWPRDEQPS